MIRPQAARETLRALFTLGCVVVAMACSCISPPPLSDCDVRRGQAALLVDVKCRKQIQCNRFSGTSVSDVEIKLVLEDKTDLELTEGDVVSIESSLQGSLCGFGLEIETQYIVFVGQTAPLNANATSSSSDIDGVLATAYDDVVCHTFDAPLSTSLCSGNIRDPTEDQITELMAGCHP